MNKHISFAVLFLTLGLSAPAQATTRICSIETYSGNYLTAVSGGGRTQDVIHSDATQVGSWEKFRLNCGS